MARPQAVSRVLWLGSYGKTVGSDVDLRTQGTEAVSKGKSDVLAQRVVAEVLSGNPGVRQQPAPRHNRRLEGVSYAVATGTAIGWEIRDAQSAGEATTVAEWMNGHPDLPEALALRETVTNLELRAEVSELTA